MAAFSDMPLNDILRHYGVTHETAGDGDRYLFWRGECFGRASFTQAVRLIDLLAFVSANPIPTPAAKEPTPTPG